MNSTFGERYLKDHEESERLASIVADVKGCIQNSTRDADIIAAMQRLRDAEEALAKVIAGHFPLGTEATWEARGSEQTGIVLQTSADRLYVRNNETHCEYWVHISYFF